ncbi:primosomal protein N' [Thaumasiovibrio subtropicus]|uniref:primosomal protein N' n=1 Tax=Thaumasiovibrio subtropicus TaxID=1891207 RepID=UPI000B34F971|nr:primosomal protein N' [Thaumasiovibrio subtropicus]
MTSPRIARVALPVPLDRLFDYKLEDDQHPEVGTRVIVPFQRRELVGFVTELTEHSEFKQLKGIKQVLDEAPLLPKTLFSLLQWASQFYQYPFGDTLSVALPSLLRKGEPASRKPTKQWHLTALGHEQNPTVIAKRAPKQAQVLGLLMQGSRAHSELLAEEVTSATLKTLAEKGWVKDEIKLPVNSTWQTEPSEEKPVLNTEQSVAIASINAAEGYHCYLLEGVTGSGKTEVYLNIIEPVLAKGQQILILVPEIGLTPQTINRFQRRFKGVPLSVIHSGLNDTERLTAWLDGRDKQAGIIIGTRSALFTPFQSLGMIIIDEEHDASYKQQDTLRYHARDLAVMRAAKEQIPIILGSATPSLESLHNAQQGKYHHLTLTQRAGTAVAARHGILDIKGQYLEGGLSAALIAEMRKHIQAGNQVLLFLNRRGFAPVMMCHECGWIADCERCDVHYTYHAHSHELRCHHCSTQRPVYHQCQSCGSTQLITAGVGTEQLEQQLETLFPEQKTIRIDRDSTRRKGSLEQYLDDIHANQYQILIGTQMLAKGHHFPNVTLVALLDVDSALFSSDFRAPERLAQLLIQVAGRAGRASKPGEVLLQTHHPDHPLLKTLLHKGYGEFAQSALEERKQTALPPYRFLAMLRAEANSSDAAAAFLFQVRQILQASPVITPEIELLGPNPAPLARRAGKYRWQLLIQSPQRRSLQQLLAIARPAIQMLPDAKRVRWTLDVEPQELS